MSLESCFPIDKIPRPLQRKVLNEVFRALDQDFDNIIIEAPVGSGKSAMALSISNFAGGGHILTPRKSLQTQYETDFPTELIGMRGRSSYTCNVKPHLTTAECPKRRASDYSDCRDSCPYTYALEAANAHKTTVHNYHSFIYQAALFDRFVTRPVIIFDEAHDLAGIIRSFGEASLTLPLDQLPQGFSEDMDWEVEDVINLLTFLVSSPDLPPEDKEKLFTKLFRINALAESLEEGNRVFSKVINPITSELTVSFIPIRVGGLVNKYLLPFGEKRIFMSGTIFTPDLFCGFLGLDPTRTKYISVPTTFPKKNRPVYNKPEYQVDTSYAKWGENFGKILEITERIFSKFHDAKGLIHAPSYQASLELYNGLKHTGRVMTHTPKNLENKLEEFYASKEAMVFISPSCQQGVDMKGDRARFQIIVRVPYLNTSDAFVSYMRENNYPWYNYQALVTFGQELGRVVRSESDFGATFLLDSRFRKFLSSNASLLPSWTKEAIIS